MKKVFLKYNPYKLETEITIDGHALAGNSRIKELTIDSRLQDWIEDLPHLLVDDYNERNFDVEFHGTALDFEDVSSVFAVAADKQILQAQLKLILAKETTDKEAKIAQIFQEIMSNDCPFPELHNPQIKAAFDLARSDEFETCVVANMSAGKSTLINAMLRTQLMPSRQEACTATITRIKDDYCPDFYAKVYDQQGALYKEIEPLTYAQMQELNDNPQVSEIHAFGSIPFLALDDRSQKKEISLVLIDTPGPNNVRNPEHRQIQRALLDQSSKALVIYVMTGVYNSNDDNNLLTKIASSMQVKGKQSKDRFIFVVNKMDSRQPEDDDIDTTLNRIREYLSQFGIHNPHLFPVSAVTALDIRRMQDPHSDMDEEEIDEADCRIRKLNRKEQFHLENWAVLPPTLRSEINDQLLIARSKWSGNTQPAVNNPDEALIHSGVVSVEAAIRQYVQKYAKTARIKNIVDTFIHCVQELKCEEQVILEIAKNEQEREQISAQIQNIQAKMSDASEAKNFKQNVDDAVNLITNSANTRIDAVCAQFQAQVISYIQEFAGKEYSTEEANKIDYESKKIIHFAEQLQETFRESLQDIVEDSICKTQQTLQSNYLQKIASLSSDLKLTQTGFVLDPLKLISGTFKVNVSKNSVLIRTRSIAEGKEWVSTSTWWKFWTWGDGYYVTQYKNESYVQGDDLAKEILKPLQQIFRENQKAVHAYVEQQCDHIVTYYNEEFANIDQLLTDKLNDLHTLTSNKEQAQQRAEIAHKHKAWLDHILHDVESILEIWPQAMAHSVCLFRPSELQNRHCLTVPTTVLQFMGRTMP